MAYVDATSDVTVLAVAEAHAVLDAIRQLDSYSGIWYSFYPEGQQMKCHVGATCWINTRLRNDGNGTGQIQLRITRLDTMVVIYDHIETLAPGEYVDLDDISFTMPANDLGLRIMLAHL